MDMNNYGVEFRYVSLGSRDENHFGLSIFTRGVLPTITISTANE